MKKKITHPDGTVVEYEGTPDELAQLEREITGSSRQDENKNNGRRILNERILDGEINEA